MQLSDHIYWRAKKTTATYMTQIELILKHCNYHIMLWIANSSGALINSPCTSTSAVEPTLFNPENTDWPSQDFIVITVYLNTTENESFNTDTAIVKRINLIASLPLHYIIHLFHDQKSRLLQKNTN